MGKKSFHPALRVLALLVALAFSAGALFAADVPRMSKEDLKSKLGTPDVMILDVRTGKDWKDSSVKIKGALRYDPSTSKTWIETLPKDKTIVLYCA